MIRNSYVVSAFSEIIDAKLFVCDTGNFNWLSVVICATGDDILFDLN